MLLGVDFKDLDCLFSYFFMNNLFYVSKYF